MARIVHLAIKVADLDKATRFYEDVFGFRETSTKRSRQHVTRHLTDGATDLALILYDSEDDFEAQLAGPGPRLHHWAIEVDDRDAIIKKIEASGGEILSEIKSDALKFRSPDGTIAEIVPVGRYATTPAE